MWTPSVIFILMDMVAPGMTPFLELFTFHLIIPQLLQEVAVGVSIHHLLHLSHKLEDHVPTENTWCIPPIHRHLMKPSFHLHTMSYFTQQITHQILLLTRKILKFSFNPFYFNDHLNIYLIYACTKHFIQKKYLSLNLQLQLFCRESVFM